MAEKTSSGQNGVQRPTIVIANRRYTLDLSGLNQETVDWKALNEILKVFSDKVRKDFLGTKK